MTKIRAIITETATIEAIKANGTKTVNTKTTTDPWWGTKTTTETIWTADGNTYKEVTSREGRKELWQVVED